MIKARSDGMVILCLEEENVLRMKAGHPIRIDNPEVLKDGMTEIYIFYGETFQDGIQLMKDLGAIPEDAVIPDPAKPERH